MIMAKPKKVDEIIGRVKDFNKVLVVGCKGCVAVCEAGGEKEAELLASALRIHFSQTGKRIQIDEVSVTRQCDKEYLRPLGDQMDDHDVVISLACGAGVQFLSEMYDEKPIFPGVDTCFIGVTQEDGVWDERCQACGDCVLGETMGICPITRCSKRMLNGPCGGSENGKCEISMLVGRDVPCGWHLIYERLKKMGQLQKFRVPSVDKDWTTSRDGGPRQITREDVRL